MPGDLAFLVGDISLDDAHEVKEVKPASPSKVRILNLGILDREILLQKVLISRRTLVLNLEYV